MLHRQALWCCLDLKGKLLAKAILRESSMHLEDWKTVFQILNCELQN